MMTSHAIDIRALEKRFPRFTLGPLDITVPRGAIYGLIGPNGAGKTTTLDRIFGMGAKDGGSITVLDLDHLRDEVAMKRQVGYVSPDLTYQAWGRVGHAIRFVRDFHAAWDDSYCAHLLESLELDLGQRIATLSFGARIKLALVLALSWKPAVLVLDEPTVGLDAISKQQVFGELLSAVGDGNRTVLISSHGLADIERFADHVGMIKKGRVLFEGATSTIIERFRLVDLMMSESADLADQPGVLVQRRDGDRWRALLDLRRVSVEELATRGVRPIADSPVTLEELFVALGRD
jgi:ABC-2 type transport system ATP-binding protein